MPDARRHCDVRTPVPPSLPPGLHADRARAILQGRTKWVNGTVLHFWFDGGPEPQRDAVRNAFKEWKALGIGLDFTEVARRSEAEVRIAFDQSDGSWSYIGRDVLGIPQTTPTMNFGWDLTDDYGHTTALHELGHTIGLPHEHQNPFAGIVWDEDAVYAYFSGEPNRWARDQTFSNVLRKLDTSEVSGSKWDPDSVMEYWFPAGLITQPAKYHEGLNPKGGLSKVDKQWVKTWFPALKAQLPLLAPFESRPLSLKPAQQADFRLEPAETRAYEVATFGTADTVLVLFEEVDGGLRHLASDDDSGTDRNAHLSVKLFAGRRYVARVRLYWAGESGQTALMYW